MDQVLRMQAQGYTLRKLELEDVAAVARCYRAPYHTYGKVKAYLDEFGKLPPAGYRLPRYKWQEKPRRGTRCRSCRHWSAETVCPMLLELQAAGLRGSVVQCSEYAKKNKRRTG